MCDPTDAALGQGVRLETLRAAAARLGVSEGYVRNLIAEGTLPGIRHTARRTAVTYVPSTALDSYIGRLWREAAAGSGPRVRKER